jgi:hypothetical protein
MKQTTTCGRNKVFKMQKKLKEARRSKATFLKVK